MSRRTQIERISLEVFEHVRQAALVNMRFLMHASALLRPLPLPGSALSTDGVYVQFDPTDLIQQWRAEPTRVTRSYVHMVLHNVFLHTYPGKIEKPALWDLACDIVVEAIIRNMNAPSMDTSLQPLQNQILDSLEIAAESMTAESLYVHFLESGIEDADAHAKRRAFFVDDHGCWHASSWMQNIENEMQSSAHDESNTQQRASIQGAGSNTAKHPSDSTQHKQHRSSQSSGEKDDERKESYKQAHMAVQGRMANTINLNRSKQLWEQAAYETGVQLDTYMKLWGSESAAMKMQLASVARVHQDYQKFLVKFARQGEHIHINNDEFDYVYYCHGLNLYGNLPLIEPLEYAEERRIKSFAIAIDTSASTKDGLVQRFFEQTSSVIGNDQSFFDDATIILFQCDAAITNETHIKTKRDFDTYISKATIEGLGGTDFRPVFARLEELLEGGGMHEFAGLIYFTDGFGTYPKNPPPFKTAFVFADEAGADAANVPPWAMKAVLNKPSYGLKG